MTRVPFMPEVLARIAPRIGATVELEPNYRFVGLVRFANGRRSFFWDNKFNLNPISSVKVVQDKAYASHFLRTMGYRVPEERTFFRDRFRRHVEGPGRADAIAYAHQLGWPVYVKPLSLSQGRLVSRAHDQDELGRAVDAIFATERSLLVQRPCPGDDHRIVVLDGRVVTACKRIPLSVVGDGAHSVDALLVELQRRFDAERRDTRIPTDDPRIDAALARDRLDRTSVLPHGRTVRLLDVANLSLGGTAEDVTARVHPTVAALAARAARDMDLRYCGVDLLLDDVAAPLDAYTIVELNSAPGLDYYTGHGPAHEAHVDDLYLQVLCAVGGVDPPG